MKKAKLTLVLLLSFLLSACSSSFVYNNIDWMMYWYVGDYVDLSSSQKAALDERVAFWQDWHRSTELIKYQNQLQSLKAQLHKGPLNQEQWLDEFDQIQQHIHRFRMKIAPDLAELAKQLSQDQVAGLLSTWQKKQQERQTKFEQESKTGQRKSRAERLIESIEDNVGKLTQQQVDIVGKYAKQLVPTYAQRTEYQRRVQNTVRHIFANRDVPDFKQQIVRLISNPDQYKTAQHQMDSDTNKRVYAQMLAQINATLTEEQAQSLDDQLEDWLSLIDD